MNKCPVGDCAAGARPGQLMCLAHWRLVPKALQNDVWKTWRALQRRSSTDTIDEYRTARDKAIAAVQKKAIQGGLF